MISLFRPDRKEENTRGTLAKRINEEAKIWEVGLWNMTQERLMISREALNKGTVVFLLGQRPLCRATARGGQDGLPVHKVSLLLHQLEGGIAFPFTSLGFHSH